jgi:hypothetical protein
MDAHSGCIELWRAMKKVEADEGDWKAYLATIRCQICQQGYNTGPDPRIMRKLRWKFWRLYVTGFLKTEEPRNIFAYVICLSVCFWLACHLPVIRTWPVVVRLRESPGSLILAIGGCFGILLFFVGLHELGSERRVKRTLCAAAIIVGTLLGLPACVTVLDYLIAIGAPTAAVFVYFWHDDAYDQAKEKIIEGVPVIVLNRPRKM